ncbi:MAG: peptidylprolyl isomerase, partial [Pyrinomonadaceae bacterium]
TLTELYAEMKKVGVNPEDLRENWRKQFTQSIVLQNDVDRKIYFGWSSKEIKDYYEQHRDKFTKPENVTLSEIFLNNAGRDMAAVKQKADQLIASMRGGADFAKVAVENSDNPDVAKTKGLVGSFNVKELNEKVASVIKGVKVGDYGKLEKDEGIEIIRVDARSNASSESVFSENAVRMEMTNEKVPVGRKKYMSTLVKEAYIKISDSYKPIVSPFLYTEDDKTAVLQTGK